MGRTVTLRPNGMPMVAGGYWFRYPGSAAIGSGDWTYLQDNDDGTYLYGIMANVDTFMLDFTSYTLAANEKCSEARLIQRIAGTSDSFSMALDTWVAVGAGNMGWGDGGGASYRGIYRRWQQVWNPGYASDFTQAAIDALRAGFRKVDDTTTPSISEVYLDLWVQTQPTVTITSPTWDQKISSTTPTISWNYNAQGDAVRAHQVKIFTSGTVGGGGFSADSSTAVYDSGRVDGAANSRATNVGLVPGGTYYAYVRLATDYRGADWWSNWTWVYFRVNVPATVSAVTVTPGSGTPVAVTSTNRPTIGWTFTDLDSDAQGAYYIRVFSEAQYSAAGFNPDSDSGAAWVSGTVYDSAARSAQTGVLSANVNYKAYVWVTDSPNPVGWWSTRAESPVFVIQTASGVISDPPAVPEVTQVTADQTNGRVAISFQGRSNLLTRNQASADTGVPTTAPADWENVSNGALSRETTTFLQGGGALRQTSNWASGAAVDMTARSGPGGTSGFSVQPNRVYTAMASSRAATTARFTRVEIRWYDSSGTSISVSQGVALLNTTTGWGQRTVTAAAPANAAFAAVLLVTLGTATASEAHLWDNMGLAPGTFEPTNLLSEATAGGEAGVTNNWGSGTNGPSLRQAGPKNLLTLNQASIEVDTTGLTAGTNATIARSTAQTNHGIASLAMTSIAAGNMVARTTSGTGGVPVTPNVQYSGHIQFRAASPAAARSCQVALVWYDSAGAWISTTTGTAAADTSTGWLTRTVTGTAPANAAFAAIEWTVLSTGAASEVHYVDQLGLWAGSGSDTYTLPGPALEGSLSVAVTATVAGPVAMNALSQPSTPVTPGLTYSARGYSRAGQTARGVGIQINWYTAASAYLSTTSPSYVTNSTTGWTEHTVTGVAPAGAALAQITLHHPTGVVGGETHYWDKLLFTQGALPTPTWTRGGLVVERGALADTFNRANSTTSLGTAETGGAWAAQTGTWGIIDNRAYMNTVTADAMAVLTSSFLLDGYVEADITLSSGRALAGLVFRNNDANNTMHVQLVRFGTTDQINLYKRVSGTWTLLASVAGAGLVLGTTYKLRVEFYGGQVYVYLGGVLRISYLMLAGELTQFGAYGKHGIYVSASATWDDNGSRIDNFKAGNPPTQTMTVQRSIDDGVTWTNLRGAAAQAYNDQLGTAYDYEVPAGVLAQYRVLATASEAGTSYSSANSAARTQDVALTLTDWWLKDPLDPTLNTKVTVQPPFRFTQKEPQQAYDPLGRSTSVVISDGQKGIEGSLNLITKTKAEYDKLRAILGKGRVLMLQDPLGRSWYVKFGDQQEWELLRAAPTVGETTVIRHVHTVSLPFVEAAAPVVA